MRVKDMGRKQQKAVFANMGNSSSSSLSNSDRDKILKKEFGKTVTVKYSPVNQAYFVMWHDQVLRVFSKKKNAEKYASKIQSSASFSKNKSITDIAEAPTKKLIKQRLIIEKKKEVEAREQIRGGMASLQEGIKGIGKSRPSDVGSAVKKTREANAEIRQGRQKLAQAKRNQAVLEKKLNKNLSFKGLQKKGIRLSKTGDIDKDGVKNKDDCRPFDKTKQGFFHGLRKKAKAVSASQKRKYGFSKTRPPTFRDYNKKTGKGFEAYSDFVIGDYGRGYEGFVNSQTA